jgi:serine/threonine-protein kinase HipA
LTPPPKRLKRLGVWMDGRRVATLIGQAGWRMQMRYDPEVVESTPGGIVLSLSMPVRDEPYPDEVSGRWADNLLPEGPPRSVIARALSVRPFDVFGILTEVGRDCAGAVTFLPEGQTPDQSVGGCRSLDDVQLKDLIVNLASHPLGVDLEGKTRLSLAGAQEKVLLTKVEAGWAQPTDGAPSTYLVKPEPPAYPGMAAAEFFALEWARAAGIDSCQAELFDIDGRPALAVRRYDREYLSDGSIKRIHQEDSCQALGRRSDHKYESQGGPTFREVARLLLNYSTNPIVELTKLVHSVVLTAAVGNADGHGKNLSLFLEKGVARLAPLYDVIPTVAWNGLDTDAGMYVNNKPDINHWELSDLVEEATVWGLPTKQAMAIVREILDRLKATFEATADVAELPSEIRRVVRARIDRLTG